MSKERQNNPTTSRTFKRTKTRGEIDDYVNYDDDYDYNNEKNVFLLPTLLHF